MKLFLLRLKSAASNPLEFLFRVAGRINPELLLNHYVSLARELGLKRSYFILSFDCDTDLDIEVVESVHSRLSEIGIIPVYAVPGQLLEKGREVYTRIAASGAEFINHGYYRHTSFYPDKKVYESFFFYDKLTRESVLDDIRLGHQAHIDVLGKAPSGFRVPHFGTFQGSNDLSFLHRTLSEMGYYFSSSTVPFYGFRYGPLHKVNGSLFEIPVSGCYDYPIGILDSWSFRYAEGRLLNEQDYVRQFNKMVQFFKKPGHVGLLNFYADPSQVYDWPDFFECLKLAVPIAVNSYSQILNSERCC